MIIQALLKHMIIPDTSSVEDDSLLLDRDDIMPTNKTPQRILHLYPHLLVHYCVMHRPRLVECKLDVE